MISPTMKDLRIGEFLDRENRMEEREEWGISV